MAMSKILIGNVEVAIWAHAQYKIGQKQPRTTGATSSGLQVAMHSQLPRFLVHLYLAADVVTTAYKTLLPKTKRWPEERSNTNPGWHTTRDDRLDNHTDAFRSNNAEAETGTIVEQIDHFHLQQRWTKLHIKCNNSQPSSSLTPKTFTQKTQQHKKTAKKQDRLLI